MRNISNNSLSLEINKVTIDEELKKINIDFCLYSIGNKRSFKALKKTKIISNSMVYFIVMSDKESEIIPYLGNLADRAKVINDIYGNNSRSSSPVSEILLEERIKKIPLKNLFSNSQNVIFKKDPTSGRETYEMHSSYIMSYNKIKDFSNLSNLSLCSFINKDISAQIKASSITTGGDLCYESLLEMGDSGRLTVPKMRRVLYTYNPESPSEPQVYTGPAHYHGPGGLPTGEDGYVGWMAGHSSGPMGQKLTLRMVENQKVVSQNARTTLEDADPKSSQLVPKMKEDWISASKNHKAINIKIDKKRKTLKNINMLRSSLDMGFLDPGLFQMSHLSVSAKEATSGVEVLGESYFSSIVGINFKSLLFKKSKFGFLIDLYDSKANIPLLSKCIAAADIKKIQITRRKLVDIPHARNSQSSLIYTTEPGSENTVRLITACDNIRQSGVTFEKKATFKNSITDTAAIEEIELYTTSIDYNAQRGYDMDSENQLYTASPTSVYSRQFLIKDYDLFRNYSDGKYTYDISLIVEDGIVSFLKSQIIEFKSVIEEYSNLLKSARYPTNNALGEEMKKGSYNYYTRRFVSSFYNSSSNKKVLDMVISTLYMMISIVSGRPKDKLMADPDFNLKNKYSLRSSTIEELEDLLSRLEKNYKKIIKLIQMENNLNNLDAPINTKDSFPERSIFKLKDEISVKIKTNIIHQAVSSAATLGDFSIPTSRNKSYVKYKDYRNNIRDIRKESGLAESSMKTLYKASGTNLKPMRFLAVAKSAGDHGDADNLKSHQYKDTSASAQAKKDNFYGSFSVVETYEQYSKKSPPSRSKMNSLLGSLLYKPSVKVSKVDDDMSYREKLWANLKASTTFGVSRDGIEPFSDFRRFYEEGFFKQVIPDVESSFRKVLCDSVQNNVKKEKFLEDEEPRYKDLSLTREKVGVLYDLMQKIFLINDSIGKFPNLVRNTEKENYYIDLNGRDPSYPDFSDVIITDPFESNVGFAQEISIGTVNPRPIDIENTEIIPQHSDISSGNPRRVIYVKYDTNTQGPAPVSVNNGILLEV